MENASKALIIAATTLLGMMILAVMVYLFTSGAELNRKYDERQLWQNLELYNSNFLKYNNDYNNITDLITLCNFAYSTNVDNDYDQGWAVEIVINVRRA